MTAAWTPRRLEQIADSGLTRDDFEADRRPQPVLHPTVCMACGAGQWSGGHAAEECGGDFARGVAVELGRGLRWV